MTHRLLRLEAVREKTGKSTSDIYGEMKEGTFPKSVPIGKRSVAWLEAEIDDWIADKIAARDGGKAKPNAGGPGRGHVRAEAPAPAAA
ncbi:MAG: AlpA family transcriptional regulator [Proteobacteria bacterium]|nr:AlpA family transcriptional regulator [Pseudomonadota bacterium]